jgi:hypothetical protein
VFKVAVMMNFDPRGTGLPSNCFEQRDAGSFGSLASPNKTNDNFDITHELVKQQLQDQTIDKALVQTIAEKYFPDLAGSPHELAKQVLQLATILQRRADNFNELRAAPKVLLEVWDSPAMFKVWTESKLPQNQGRIHNLDFAMEADFTLSSMDWQVACLKRSLKDAAPNPETVTQQVDSIIAAVSKSREDRLQNSYSQQLCSAVDALVLATATNKIPLSTLKHLHSELNVFNIRPRDVMIKYWSKMEVNTYPYGYGYSAVLGHNDELLKFILKNHPAEIFNLATKQLEPEQVARVRSCIPEKDDICQYINAVAAAAKDDTAIPGIDNPALLIAKAINLLNLNGDLAGLLNDIKSGIVPSRSSFKVTPVRPVSRPKKTDSEPLKGAVLPAVPSDISQLSLVEQFIAKLPKTGPSSPKNIKSIFTPEKTWDFLLSAIDVLNTDNFEIGRQLQNRIANILGFLTKRTNFDINSFNPKTEMTLLMHAAAAGNEYFVEVLGRMGANPTLVTQNGKSAADLAEAKGYIRLSKFLKEDAENFSKS